MNHVLAADAAERASRTMYSRLAPPSRYMRICVVAACSIVGIGLSASAFNAGAVSRSRRTMMMSMKGEVGTVWMHVGVVGGAEQRPQ